MIHLTSLLSSHIRLSFNQLVFRPNHIRVIVRHKPIIPNFNAEVKRDPRNCSGMGSCTKRGDIFW
nr:MAG TPA: hypothetical protein [Bacteriophage sp.]